MFCFDLPHLLLQLGLGVLLCFSELLSGLLGGCICIGCAFVKLFAKFRLVLAFPLLFTLCLLFSGLFCPGRFKCGLELGDAAGIFSEHFGMFCVDLLQLSL